MGEILLDKKGNGWMQAVGSCKGGSDS